MKPFDKDAKFLGAGLFPTVRALPSFTRNNMLKILADLGIPNPDAQEFYDLEIILNFYRRLAKEFGPNTVFDLGKAVPGNAVFPPGVDSIESAFQLIDVAYNMNHQGYVGFYKVDKHDIDNKTIVMHCYNPYPCDFDRGLFTSMARKFETGVRVVVDTSKPHKKQGGDESWYIITYR
jgi:hypothetical protein